jgi:hypothetical protein
MKTLLKMLGLLAGGLLALLALAIVAVCAISTYQTSKTYAVPDARLAMPIPSDAAAIARGRYLVPVVGARRSHSGAQRVSGQHLVRGLPRQSFSGGAVPGAGPSDPKARNLTPGGNLGRWSEAQFIATLRSGKTPEGADLNPLRMPWPVFAKMTDDDLRALYAYFKTLPARADEQP